MTGIRRTLLAGWLALNASAPAWAGCDAGHGFGIAFGSNVKDHQPVEIRSERALPRFASYRVDAEVSDPRFAWYSVETDRRSGSIFAVTAYQPIDAGVDLDAEYKARVIPLARELMRKLSEETGIPVDVSGSPPFSGKTGDVELSLWLRFEPRGKKASFAISCTDLKMQDSLYRAIVQDEPGSLLKRP